MNDTSVTWYELSMVCGAVVAAGTLVASIVCWNWTRLNTHTAEMSKLRLDTTEALAAYKLEAAKYYATEATVIKVEERLAAAIDRLSDKIQNTLEKVLLASHTKMLKT